MNAFQATWKQGAVAYRRSAVGRHDPHRLATWLRAAERNCTLGDFPAYDRDKLEAALPELRSLTVEDPVQAIQRAQALLRDCGVALTLVPSMPGLGTQGATRWIHGHPLIQLSDLWKRDDQLWFTLFHEIAHVLLHESNGLYLNDDHDALEKEADAYASRFLVPEDYEDRLPRHRNLDEVKALAKELASIFHWLVEWGLVASLPVSWLGLCRLGVTACRVSSRGGRAFPGARGFFLQGRGGQEAGAVCLRSR